MGDLLRGIVEAVFEGAQPRTCMVDVSQDLPTGLEEERDLHKNLRNVASQSLHS